LEKLCYTVFTQKNNADHPALAGDRVCRLTAVFGDKETRCKSVATAIAVMSCLATLSRNAYRSVLDKKLLGKWGERSRENGYGRVSFLAVEVHPMEGAFVLSFLCIKTRKEIKK
jgi:hypothetical protein